jgi:hypothetical protein
VDDAEALPQLGQAFGVAQRAVSAPVV